LEPADGADGAEHSNAETQLKHAEKSADQAMDELPKVPGLHCMHVDEPGETAIEPREQAAQSNMIE
jgi:hypothetical protein